MKKSKFVPTYELEENKNKIKRNSEFIQNDTKIMQTKGNNFFEEETIRRDLNLSFYKK